MNSSLSTRTTNHADSTNSDGVGPAGGMGVPRHDSTVRLSLTDTLLELGLGVAVAAVLSLVMQFAIVRIGISEPSYAPEALATVGSALVLATMFLTVAFGRHRAARWLRLVGTWASLTAFVTCALAIPLQSTRFYFGGSTADNAFRMQYLTRMANTAGLADMNYADIAPYYPAGWFWLGGRFANLLGWEGWAAYKPYSLMWLAVTAVVAFTLWSLVVRRRLALLAALLTAAAGMLHGVEEPYAWPSAAWLPPLAILAWHALRQRQAPRWTLWLLGAYVGFAAVTYTLHFGFAVMAIVLMAVIVGVLQVKHGAKAKPVIAQLFLRLLPIGVLSFLIALLAWGPYLWSTGFLLSNPPGAAQRYLPESGAFLPTPMAEATAFGVLCLAGLIWMLLRCRENEIAAALLTVVVAVYCWFALSTLALLGKTTLLAFRLNVILDVTLATAGILGLLELLTALRNRLAESHGHHYRAHVTAVACAIGLLGTVAITQDGVGTSLATSTEQAYSDAYPTGDNARGERDPSKSGAQSLALRDAITGLTKKDPQQTVVLSTDYKMLSYTPFWSFQQETPHYANPLSEYDTRASLVQSWANARTSAEFLGMLEQSPFHAPDVFVLRKPTNQAGPAGSQPDSQAGSQTEAQAERPAGKEGTYALNLKDDAFPQLPNVRDYEVYFAPSIFDSAHFQRADVGPYVVFARR